MLTPYLVKLFRLGLSPSTFPSCWKDAYVQPVPKKGDCSNNSNYRPIALISYLSKTFETILNRKLLKHPSSFSLLSDHQYEFRKGRSTGDLPVFLNDSWSSSLSRFGETFSVTLDISKAFDRLWHKALLSKLPSYGFYPALCSFLSSLFSGRSITAVEDGHCSTSKSNNSGVPHGSILSPTLYYSSIIIFPLQMALSTLILMTPLCTIPRPLTYIQFNRNCRYQGTMLQNA